MVEKPTDANGNFERTHYGNGARVVRAGFPEKYARELLKATGDKYLVPVEEKK